MKSDGFRMVPNWLVFEQLKERRESRQPWTKIESWCSMDLDQYRHSELSSERAYAAQWRRSREWTSDLMRHFRQEHGLPAPAPGRRPRPNPAPRRNDGLPTKPDYLKAISEAES